MPASGLTYNVAGRGGTIFRVNTLADDRAAPVAVGDGTYRSSLRAAVEAAGPRVVVFETSGVICLTEALVVYEPYLTIAGQTAPSPGINVRCNPFRVDAHDVLVQHIRFRFDAEVGYPGSYETWPVQLGGTYNWTYNVVLDHVSVAFGNGYMSIGLSTVGQPEPLGCGRPRFDHRLAARHGGLRAQLRADGLRPASLGRR